MSTSFRFNCPKCRRKYKANKDLSGRLKRCGECRHSFTIDATASDGTTIRRAHTAPDPELSIDEVFAALHEWQRHARSLPGAFAREVTFGHFEPAYRLTLEMTADEHGHRVKHKAQLATAGLPAEVAPGAARPVADLPFEHSADVLERLPAKHPALRHAAEQLLRETQKPAHLVGRRLVIEHLGAWKAHWVFQEKEGGAWFSGSPLRLHLPDPPRRSATAPVLVTVLVLGLLGGGVYGARALGLFDATPAPAAPAPVAPAPKPKPEALRFSRDGVLQLDDGVFLRGGLERKDDSVIVSGARPQTVPTWQIESVQLDAPVFLRGEARRLDDLENRARLGSDAKREVLVGLFLEVQRQRDRWTRLEPLCTSSEIPAPAPQKRLDALQVELAKRLETTAIVAAPVNPTTPEAAPKPVEPTPSAKLAADLLGQIAGAPDADARRRIAGGLQALKGERLPQADLLHIAALYLGRSETDAGLVADRVHLKTAQVDSTFEGVLVKNVDGFVSLRIPSGQEVTAYREKNAWVAQLPGDVRLAPAQCTVTPGARTAAGDRLKAALDRLPPAKWMTATGADHLGAAKSAAEAKGGLVRSLAAAHAAATLHAGTPSEILEARGVLHGLGYAPSADGRWERAEDRRAAQLGQYLRDGKADEARSLVPTGRSAGDFAASYRAAAVQLQAPMRGREDVDRAAGTLDAALGLAVTAPESRHLLALKSAISAFGVCRDCGGGAAKSCLPCRGTGKRTEACAACRGLGYIATVGIGATGARTCESCGGKPIKGQRPCERCEGKGTRSCAKCQGVAKLPAAADLCRTSVCARCSGTGGGGDLVRFSCPPCAGLGLQLLPAGAPDAVLP